MKKYARITWPEFAEHCAIREETPEQPAIMSGMRGVGLRLPPYVCAELSIKDPNTSLRRCCRLMCPVWAKLPVVHYTPPALDPGPNTDGHHMDAVPQALVAAQPEMNFETHIELIICPACKLEQPAVVEHTPIFWSYVHHCTACKYIIMESEWERVK